MVRAHKDAVTWIAWLFPNTYAVDPIRDLVLFNTWPLDFWQVLITLFTFASVAVFIGSTFSIRKLRRFG
jgi:ABC-type multidrug transport system permease subunit